MKVWSQDPHAQETKHNRRGEETLVSGLLVAQWGQKTGQHRHLVSGWGSVQFPSREEVALGTQKQAGSCPDTHQVQTNCTSSSGESTGHRCLGTRGSETL